jgi:hypothetical protein
MRPFQEFRLWTRRAPGGERALALVGVSLVVALFAWMLVPDDGGTPTDSAIAGAGVAGTGAPGVGATGPADGGSAATTDGSAVAGPAGSAGAASGGAAAPGTSGPPATAGAGGPKGCQSPPGSATGVSATEMKIGVTLVNIAGAAANTLFGVPSAAEQKSDYEAVIAAVNREGGIACRKLVPRYWEVNPVDLRDTQQTCLDVAQAGVFANLDVGAWTLAGPACFAQNKIPYFGGGNFISQKQAESLYPYVFAFNTFDNLQRDTTFGLRDRGFFDPAKGFKKLGFFHRDCNPEVISKQLEWFRRAGVAESQVVSYNFGCPFGTANPADVTQAVLKFKSEGVTHVTYSNAVGDLPSFTRTAQQQAFKPMYGLPDDAMIQIFYGSQPPDRNNLTNAIAIVPSRDAEERTPGYQPSAGTQRCNAAYAAAKLPAVYRETGSGPLAGNVCNQLWMLKAGVENAAALRQDQVALGLQKAKSVDFSYPQGPNDFSAPKVTYGGQFWRVAQLMPSCGCWQIIEREFKPSFR